MLSGFHLPPPASSALGKTTAAAGSPNTLWTLEFVDAVAKAGPRPYLTTWLACHSQYQEDSRSPRPPTLQHLSADKGAHCPHLRVGNTCSSHLSTVMTITCSAKQGAWFSQDARQARPIHAIPSGHKISPLGWKSLADSTVFLASVGLILSIRHKVSLCLLFFFFKISILCHLAKYLECN